jgi:hypothetical protein
MYVTHLENSKIAGVGLRRDKQVAGTINNVKSTALPSQ